MTGQKIEITYLINGVVCVDTFFADDSNITRGPDGSSVFFVNGRDVTGPVISAIYANLERSIRRPAMSGYAIQNAEGLRDQGLL